jgi:hypothetical protein
LFPPGKRRRTTTTITLTQNISLSGHKESQSKVKTGFDTATARLVFVRIGRKETLF